MRRKDFEIIDTISQAGISIFSDIKNNDDLLLIDSNGRERTLKFVCQGFIHRMAITNGERTTYIILVRTWSNSNS